MRTADACSRAGISLPWIPIAVCLALLPIATEAGAQERRIALPLPPALKSPYLDMCKDANESQLVVEYDGSLGVTKQYVQLHSKSTVQLQWKTRDYIKSRLPGYDLGNVAEVRWCTGTLITEDVVLTAGHCFDIQTNARGWTSPFRKIAGKIQFAGPEVLATLMQVNFGYVHDGGPADAFPITKLEEWRLGSDKLDYAIVKIGRDAQGNLPSVKYHPIASIRLDDPKKGDAIAIIQHPHGQPMQVEAGPVFELIGHSILYDDVDTFGGSSGSGIRDQDGVVVGVHTHGGCEAGFANGGVKNSAIAQVSKTLRSIAKR